MRKKSTIKNNILRYLNIKGISKYRFYKETGITRSVLDKDSGLSEENTAKFIAQYPEVNLKWLLTGKGKMLVEEKTEDSPNLEKAHKAQADCQEKVEKMKEELDQKNKLIKYLETDLKKCKQQLFFKGQPVPRDT